MKGIPNLQSNNGLYHNFPIFIDASNEILKLSQRLNDEVIRKCGPKFLIKWLGPNGPNQRENLH